MSKISKITITNSWNHSLSQSRIHVWLNLAKIIASESLLLYILAKTSKEQCFNISSSLYSSLSTLDKSCDDSIPDQCTIPFHQFHLIPINSLKCSRSQSNHATELPVLVLSSFLQKSCIKRQNVYCKS